jgi:hypothetical protein
MRIRNPVKLGHHYSNNEEKLLREGQLSISQDEKSQTLA